LQLIINEVKPQIREEVTKLVESVMNDAFSKLPADDFLEKLPPAGPSSRDRLYKAPFRPKSYCNKVFFTV
jgi:hypothetical protein